jgi:proteasome assembly chaperone 3
MASIQHNSVINDVPTTFLINSYADRIMVLVTQLGKVGNLVGADSMAWADGNPHYGLKIQATLLTTEPLSNDDQDEESFPAPSPATQLTPLLGSSASEHQQTLHSLYAAQIATIVWDETSQFSIQGTRRSVIVGIALKKRGNEGEGCELSDSERATFREIVKTVQKVVRS